jgi:agmatine deiminase
MTNPLLHPPAEWAPHAAIWTAWPADEAIWFEPFEGAQREIAAMIRALAADGADGRPGDAVKVLVMGPEARLAAEEAVGGCAELIDGLYGDTWLRDTGPIFYSNDRCAVFEFNGWGGKYVYEFDDQVADQIVEITGAKAAKWSRVLEGGGIDWDGEGTCLTTRECLLNPNRNPQLDEAGVEALLRDALGVAKVIWIDRGLLNDHTDGHVDNIARFVAPGVVVCQSPAGPDDPHAERLREIRAQLQGQRDARGRMLQVVEIPAPGRVLDAAGEIMPASHVNFIIGNATVVTPTYGTATSKAAVEALQRLFPGRGVVGLPANHILTGGGAFHCITQQQPA